MEFFTNSCPSLQYEFPVWLASCPLPVFGLQMESCPKSAISREAITSNLCHVSTATDSHGFSGERCVDGAVVGCGLWSQTIWV